LGLRRVRASGISFANRRVPLDEKDAERRKVWREPEMQQAPIRM